jgi:hypothetical protein
METPDQLLERLDRMGEDRVRGLLGREYFESKQVSLVQGWLSRKEQARVGNHAAKPDFDEALGRARALARQASEAAASARESAARAGENAVKAQRVAMIAVAIGSAGLLVSVLTLFALAIR